jgi:integrase
MAKNQFPTAASPGLPRNAEKHPHGNAQPFHHPVGSPASTRDTLPQQTPHAVGLPSRLHDLRHTMAVHTLLRWYRVGADLDAKLPVLATHLGHQSVAGTQRYLHLTAELFPEITIRANAAFGDVIPRRAAS